MSLITLKKRRAWDESQTRELLGKQVFRGAAMQDRGSTQSHYPILRPNSRARVTERYAALMAADFALANLYISA